mgnify:CR=1 FL=1
MVGSDSLSQLFFGGGGGSGGFHDTSGYTGPAGNGGGIIYITAAAITLNGTIEADGGDAGGVAGAYIARWLAGRKGALDIAFAGLIMLVAIYMLVKSGMAFLA